MGTSGDSLAELQLHLSPQTPQAAALQASAPPPPATPMAAAPLAPPVPLDLRRTVSTPNSGASQLQPIPREDLRRSEEGRRRPRKSPDEGRLALAKAVEALCLKVEGLGARLEEERMAGLLREANISRLAEVLASAAENLAVAAPPSPEPQPLARTVREEEIEAVVDAKARARDERLAEALASVGAQLERQAQQQEEQWACQRRLLEEKASNVQALQEVVDVVRGLKGQASSEEPVERSRHAEPRYRPHVGADGRLYEFPEVQVAVKINQVSNVDTKQLTFEADFICYLEWCDPNVTDIPSDELKTLDWTQYFNPQIEVDNAKDASGWLDGMDGIPRRPRAYCHDGSVASLESLGGSVESSSSLALGPRLRKTMRFKGALSMATVNLKCFPFDIQMLPIKLKAKRCRGLTLGTPAGDWADREQVSRVHLAGASSLRSLSSLEAGLRAAGQGHFALRSAGDCLLEFRLCGLRGYHPEELRQDIYEVSVFVARPFFASYFWDLVIMNLFVMLAATAFWDTAAPELSSRMSISLTVILTLAAYTSSRPEPIAKAPYVTFHDWCEQMSMFLVTGISAQNVFAVVMCGGQHGEAPPYMVAEFLENEESCSLGWCKSRSVDCQGLVVLLATWLALAVYSCVWLVRTRRGATKDLRNRVLQLEHGHDGPRLCEGLKSSGSSYSLDSWGAKVRRCCSWALGLTARCCRCRCRTVVEARGGEAGGPPSPDPRASLVGPGSSPEGSPARPRPRPLALGLDGGNFSRSSSPSASPPASVASSRTSSQVRSRSRPSRTATTPPHSARFGVPASTSPACPRSPWRVAGQGPQLGGGLSPVSPSLQRSTSSVSHETSISSHRPFFS